MIDNNQQKFDNNQQFNFGFGFENLEIEKKPSNSQTGREISTPKQTGNS